MGKAKTQRRLMDNLENVFEKVHLSYEPPLPQPMQCTEMRAWCLELLWLEISSYRFRENFIYQLETFQMWSNLGRSWVVIVLMILRSWSQKWFRRLMTCLAMTSRSCWKISGICTTKLVRNTSRKLEVGNFETYCAGRKQFLLYLQLFDNLFMVINDKTIFWYWCLWLEWYMHQVISSLSLCVSIGFAGRT